MGETLPGNLTYVLVPIAVAALGAWSLWLGRSRLKRLIYLPVLATAGAVVLVKGFVFPDSDTRHPLVDGSMMLLGFLIVTRFRLDRLARQSQLQAGLLQDPLRTRLIWAGIWTGLLCDLAWLVLEK